MTPTHSAQQAPTDTSAPSSSPTKRQKAPRKTPTQITDAKEVMARRHPVHVGIDTGKSFHKLVARSVDGVRTKAVRVDVTRAGFEAADRFLTETFPGVPRAQMLVGVEFAGHNGFTFAYFLAKQGYKVVSVLPAVTKRHKADEDNSPRKDDDKDAAQICKLLSHGLFVGFPLLDDRGAELRLLATERQRLAAEETRLKNRVHAALDLAWPEFAGQFSSLDKATPLALLARWPVAADLADAAPQAVHALAKKVSRNHVKAEQVRTMLSGARSTIALEEGTAARRAEIQRLMARWALLRQQTDDIEARLAEIVAGYPAAAALLTVPEVGVVCAATLVAELGDPTWYESPRQVLKLAGMNLGGRQSGTSVRGRVRQTKHGRPLLRRQLFLLAGRWCQKRGLYRERYEAMLAGGQSRTSAVCAIARKLVPMLLTVMQTEQAFDLALWRANRHTNGESPYRAA